MLKLASTLLFTLSLCISGMAIADDNARNEAEALLNTLNIQELLDRTIEQSLETQLKQNPDLIPYKQVMLSFLAKYMSYPSIKPELVNIYAEAFSAAELREISDFYKTPTGQKTIRKMPELMKQGGEIGARRVHEHIQELQRMIEAESDKIGAEHEKEIQVHP